MFKKAESSCAVHKGATEVYQQIFASINEVLRKSFLSEDFLCADEIPYSCHLFTINLELMLKK